VFDSLSIKQPARGTEFTVLSGDIFSYNLSDPVCQERAFHANRPRFAACPESMRNNPDILPYFVDQLHSFE